MEGASVTVREAMVQRVPVVAAAAPGTVESLDGHGRIFEPHDIAGAAGHVREVLQNRESARTLCERARESAVTRFAIDKTIEGTLQVYASVLKGG